MAHASGSQDYENLAKLESVPAKETTKNSQIDYQDYSFGGNNQINNYKNGFSEYGTIGYAGNVYGDLKFTSNLGLNLFKNVF